MAGKGPAAEEAAEAVPASALVKASQQGHQEPFLKRGKVIRRSDSNLSSCVKAELLTPPPTKKALHARTPHEVSSEELWDASSQEAEPGMKGNKPASKKARLADRSASCNQESQPKESKPQQESKHQQKSRPQQKSKPQAGIQAQAGIRAPAEIRASSPQAPVHEEVRIRASAGIRAPARIRASAEIRAPAGIQAPAGIRAQTWNTHVQWH